MNLDVIAFYRELLRADGGTELVPTDPLCLLLMVLGASDFFSSAEPMIRALVPDGADMDQLSADFQAFLVATIFDGLRKR